MCACSTPGLLPHPAALDCQRGHTPGAAVGPTSAPGTPRWPPRPALSHPLPADTAPRAAGAPGAGSPGPAAAEALPAGHAGAAAAAPSRPLWRPGPEHFGLQDGICSFSAAWIGKGLSGTRSGPQTRYCAACGPGIWQQLACPESCWMAAADKRHAREPCAAAARRLAVAHLLHGLHLQHGCLQQLVTVTEGDSAARWPQLTWCMTWSCWMAASCRSRHLTPWSRDAWALSSSAWSACKQCGIFCV